MTLRLTDYLERPAIIQEERKRYASFLITPIGGPEEIIKWRAERDRKLAEMGASREESKLRKAQFLAGGEDAPIGELTWKGKVLLSDPKQWDEKLFEAKLRRKELQKRFEIKNYQVWHPRDIEDKTLWQRFKKWVAGS